MASKQPVAGAGAGEQSAPEGDEQMDAILVEPDPDRRRAMFADLRAKRGARSPSPGRGRPGMARTGR